MLVDIVLIYLLGSSNATPFRQDARTPDWLVPDAQEFVPRRLENSMVKTPFSSTNAPIFLNDLG